MPDEKTQSTDGDTPETTPGESDSSKKEIQNPDAYIAAMEKRVQEREDKIRALNDRLSAMEVAQQDRMQKNGEYQELYNKVLTEVERLRLAEAELVENRTALQTINDSTIEQLPEKMRAIVPQNMSPVALSGWLYTAAPLLKRKPAPDIDAGAGGVGSRKAVTLTDEERQAARGMGMTEEDYIKHKR